MRIRRTRRILGLARAHGCADNTLRNTYDRCPRNVPGVYDASGQDDAVTFGDLDQPELSKLWKGAAGPCLTNAPAVAAETSIRNTYT